MKKIFRYFLLFIFGSTISNAQSLSEFNFYKQILVKVQNPTEIEREDQLVSINVEQLQSVNESFNKDAFIVYADNKEIPKQIYKNGDNYSILFVCNLKPNQTKEFIIKYLDSGKLIREYANRTYAELAMKFDAVYTDKKFKGNQFFNFSKLIVPKIHTDHDALFKYEGPGWESEKVGYRFYLDWRNATDIFGKKVNELVLHKVGTNDVIAKDDSYHEMQNWGMDIFKVGTSLGIGSIGMMNYGKIEMVSVTDQIICEIPDNGPILSKVRTTYNGWKVGENKFDLISNMSIAAGSRLTNVELEISGQAANITTGLVKHENTEFLKSENEGDWQFIALYGKQSLSGDNLGIVLFYNKSALLNLGDDEINYFVSLKPNNGNVNYYFGAAWESEFNGIKNQPEFEKYINSEIVKMNNPVVIELIQD